MADIEKIEQAMRDGLDACTSGPWSVDNHIITPGDIGESWAVFETCEDDPPIIMCLEWQQEANARHIARCDPDTIRALLDELSRLREVEHRAKEVIGPAFVRKLETYLSIYSGDKELAGMLAAARVLSEQTE